MKRISAFLLCISLLAGCVQGPDYVRPEVEVPAAYRSSGFIANHPSSATHDRWWTGYGDRHLDALVNEGIENNRDLRIATARVDEFAAILAGTKSQACRKSAMA